MRIELLSSWRCGRLKIALAVALLVFLSVAFSEIRAEAASFSIPAWTFDRGNAKVGVNPDTYADYRDKWPGLILTGGEQLPWVVEYDVDFPADGAYTLHVRYGSPEPRPLDVLLDGKNVGRCGGRVTGNVGPYPDRHPKNDAPRHSASNFHGAEWDEACKFQAAKGKHTLKFTRDGLPPRLIRLRLETTEAFPPDWKPAERKVDINKIPPRYRTIFLTPGDVNTATLQTAIEETIFDYGPQYAKGPQYLKQLAELKEKQIAVAGGTPEQKLPVEDALRSLRRQAMLDHPLLQFEKLLFVKRITDTAGHIYEDPYGGTSLGGNLCILSPVAPDGKVTEIAPQLSGGLFGRFDLSYDAKRVVFAYKKAVEDGYRIYEIGIDGKGLRQLTFDPPDQEALCERYGGKSRRLGHGYDDMDPCYLPSGQIMFASTRTERIVFCLGTSVTTLHVIDDNGKNLRCVSEGPITEIDPSVMDDGRIIYTRWEYVDKGFGNVQSLWSMRPDGSGTAHVYKNNVILPGGMVDARSIPGSQQIVTIAAPHCGLAVGPVVLVDNRVTRRNQEAMTNLTPEIGLPGMFHHRDGQSFEKYGHFKEPFAFSEKFFLVAHNPHKGTTDPTGYGIYALDAWGNRAELYRDPELSCFQPIPLRPRRMPSSLARVTPPTESPGEKPASVFMTDVYRGLAGIERGRIKYLRVMEAMALSWEPAWRAQNLGDVGNLQASSVSFQADPHMKKVHGIVEVHEDGSAYFTVPARKNLFFQALDENYMEVQRMRSFVNLMPGEQRSCIGCHELRKWAPNAKRASAIALDRPVQTIVPQPGDTGPYTVHFPRDIQPIFDRRCAGCHGGENPKGDLDLGAELTTLFCRSYKNLIDKNLVSFLDGRFGSANVPVEPPMTFGSHRAKLVERILHDPCKADLTREEFIKIVTWIDANSPYYGTHVGKKNLKWKDEPDFRPMPLAGK